MKFTPKTEEELNAPLYEPDIYNFRVAEAEQTISKAGNPMIKVSLEIQKDHRKPMLINDYLLTTDEAQFKLYTFCKAIGKKELYKSGEIGEFDLKEQRGQAKFDLEEYNEKKYLRVKYYIDVKAQETPSAEKTEPDDDIPF